MYLGLTKQVGRVGVFLALGLGITFPAYAGLVNGSFEDINPSLPLGTYIITNQNNVPGWLTTSTDSNIEVWSNGFSSSSNGAVFAYEGQQFAEINATQFATLYQDVLGIASGSIVGFQFAHRGRSGVDSMRLTITDLGSDGLLNGIDDTILFSNDYSDGNDAWGFYTSAGESAITALGNTTRFAYQALTTASGNDTVGNFIDAADFGVGVGGSSIPEPGTLALLGLGLAGFGVARRRK